MSAKVLPFGVWPADSATVGSVHPDGSIDFAGVRYATIRDLPARCEALRADVESYTQWKALYNFVRRRSVTVHPTKPGAR